MKRLIFLFAGLVSLFLVVGCSEKFNVAAPYKNITVVYALLDASDTAHYVRIEKAFLDQNKSAITMAQVADSSYYNNINVRIGRFSADGFANFHDTIHLNRVDLTQEGYPKQAGAFFTAPNYAYKFKNALDPQYFYRIYVTNLATGEVDSADAPVIADNNVNTFNVPIIDDQGTNLDGINFYSVIGTKSLDLSGGYIAPSNYSMDGQTNPIGIAQAIITFNWVDSDITTQQKSNHSANYDAGYLATNSGQFDFKIPNLSLYAALSAAMGQAPANVVRLIGRCNLFFYLSTPDYYQYQQISLTQGTGLTGSEIEPTYTNLKGANVLGLYTSRGLRTGAVTITERTVDSLIVSPIMAQTNLKGTAY